MERVIITGGSKGLGLEISKHFLSQGAEVICLSRDKPPLGVIHLPVDFTNQASIQTAIQKIKDIYMDFTTFVCCAGIGYIEKLDEINYEHTQAMFDVNIIGQGYLLSGISQQIKNAGADVIFVGVTIGYKGNEFMPMYSASKRGFRGLVENWRLALKSSPCRVICASPGGMNTDSNIWPQGRETQVAEIEGRTVGTFLDTSAVAEFIVSLTKLPKNMEISEVIINRK